MHEKRVRPLVVVCAVLAAACVVSTSLAIYFGVRPAKGGSTGDGGGDGGGGDGGEDGSGGDEGLPPSPSVEGAYWKAAVAANGLPCSRIGTDILMRGGSAVEAAVAALLCDGVANPQSMGIGGGFLMLIYNHSTGTVEALNAREVAPLAATKDMYNGDDTLMQTGGLSVAVPGELKGYQKAVERYKSDKVSWSELVEPTIKICQEGIPVTAYVANAIRSAEQHIMQNPSLGAILAPSGTLLKEGDLMKRPQLADTLQIIAENGADAFYNGELGDLFVSDVKDFGGIITKEDLEQYEVVWSESVKANLSNGYQMHTVPLPGSGPLLAFMLNILDGWIPAADTPITWQRIVEAFKFAYGRRTELGDNPDFAESVAQLVKNLTSPEYALNIRRSILDDRTFNDPEHYGAVVIQPDNHGTAHVSVVAPNGDAVSVTSTINLLFGAKIRSVKTGIILNDEMDDFSAPNITNAYGVPPSPANFIAPGRSPLSSMCPTIITDANSNVRLVTGAAGGTKITTATALSIINNMWFNMGIKESVDARRIHHQIFPMDIQYEEGFSEKTIKALKGFGHTTEEYSTGSSFVAAIAVNESAPYQKIFANSDFRRLGGVAGF